MFSSLYSMNSTYTFTVKRCTPNKLVTVRNYFSLTFASHVRRPFCFYLRPNILSLMSCMRQVRFQNTPSPGFPADPFNTGVSYFRTNFLMIKLWYNYLSSYALPMYIFKYSQQPTFSFLSHCLRLFLTHI